MTNCSIVDRLLESAVDVPTLPATMLRVMELADDPNCSSADLAQVVLTDASLAAQVLKLANSSYYGFAGKISSVHQAVVLLGLTTLKNALLSTSVLDIYRNRAVLIDIEGLWLHSVATATAAKLIAKRVHYRNAEKAYTVGLLHDIGKIVVARYHPASLSAVSGMVRKEHCSVYDAEERILGASHAAIGGALMERWNMPQAITEAVTHHHHPTRSEGSFHIAAICYLANILAHRCDIGNSGDPLMRELDPMINEYFGINGRGMRELEQLLAAKRTEIELFCAVASSRS